MTDSHRMGSSASRGSELINLLFIALVGWWMLQLQPAPQGVPIFEQRDLQPCQMDQYGYLRGELFGSVKHTLDWRGESMLCDGMLRPNNGGLRLVFSEYTEAPGSGLRLVIGLLDAVSGADGSEHIANVTLIDQDRSLFFSTQGLERCWVKIIKQTQLPGPTQSWRIDGELYCVGALASVDGRHSVTLGDIDFSGRITIGQDEQL